MKTQFTLQWGVFFILLAMLFQMFQWSAYIVGAVSFLGVSFGLTSFVVYYFEHA